MKKSYVLEKIIDNKKNNIANCHIGMIIKKKRLESKMTLEETTKGICCVSYLSKLEHGIIEPKKYVMQEVLERLNVKDTALRSSVEYDELILDVLKAIKDCNIDRVNSIYNTLSDDDDIHFADVIRAAYFLQNKNYDEAIKCIEKTLSVKEHLDNQEIIAVILLIAIYNYELKDYGESLDCCLLLDGYFISDLHTNILRLKLIIENKYILGEYSTLNDYITIYQSLCVKTCDSDGMKRSFYLYSMSIANTKQRYEAFKVYNNVSESLSTEKKLMWEKDLYITLNDVDEALKYELTTVEKLWAYDVKGNKEMIEQLIKEINIDSLDIMEKIFVESIRLKYFDNEFSYIQYLRKTAFAFACEHGIYRESNYYGKILIEEFAKKSRYKEALLVYGKIFEMHDIRWKI